MSFNCDVFFYIWVCYFTTYIFTVFFKIFSCFFIATIYIPILVGCLCCCYFRFRCCSSIFYYLRYRFRHCLLFFIYFCDCIIYIIKKNIEIAIDTIFFISRKQITNAIFIYSILFSQTINNFIFMIFKNTLIA